MFNFLILKNLFLAMQVLFAFKQNNRINVIKWQLIRINEQAFWDFLEPHLLLICKQVGCANFVFQAGKEYKIRRWSF